MHGEWVNICCPTSPLSFSHKAASEGYLRRALIVSGDVVRLDVDGGATK